MEGFQNVEPCRPGFESCLLHLLAFWTNLIKMFLHLKRGWYFHHGAAVKVVEAGNVENFCTLQIK